MIPARSWVAAGAAAVITGSVVGIVTVPVTSDAGTGLLPAAVLNLPVSRGPLPTNSQVPDTERGPLAPAAERSPLGGPVSGKLAPTALSIPSLGIDQQVGPVGVRPDGLMEVPDDPRVVGWYRFGAEPGDLAGAVVLAAHVDSGRFGIGPFAKLSRLRAGASVIVRTDAGEIAYRVTDLRVIGKESLPLDAVFDRGNAPRLHLVTCAGGFSSRTGWDSNLVVVASPVQ